MSKSRLSHFSPSELTPGERLYGIATILARGILRLQGRRQVREECLESVVDDALSEEPEVKRTND